jgi:hypothetical protein
LVASYGVLFLDAELVAGELVVHRHPSLKSLFRGLFPLNKDAVSPISRLLCGSDTTAHYHSIMKYFSQLFRLAIVMVALLPAAVAQDGSSVSSNYSIPSFAVFGESLLLH